MPESTKELYNSRIIDTYLKLIKRKYSYVNISDLLEHSGIKPYEVADPAHWFTQNQIDLFYERTAQLTGNANIAREAGRYAASPEALGIFRQYLLGMFSPARVYELVGRAASKFTRSATYTSNKISENKVEIKVTINSCVNEQPFQCENRKGFFEAVVMMLNYHMPSIDHPECIFEGGKSCRYIISWKKNATITWKHFRNRFTVLAVLILLLSPFAALPVQTSIIFSVLAILILIIFLITEHKDKKTILQSLDNLWESTDKYIDQLNVNYNNALLTNEIGQAISRQTNVEPVLDSVIQILKKRLDYDRGMILLADEEKTLLSFKKGFGYPADQLETLQKTSFHLDRPESKGIFILSFREKRPFLINDINDIEADLSARSLLFARKLGAQSFICCPIICEGEALGVLAVDNLMSKRRLVQSDMSLLMGIAPVLGIAIRNAELLQASNKQFTSILKVMAASIDARDPLTAGHSEKVTEYSLGISRELGLPEEFQEMVRVAAMLHDYGKIGVPDSILKKNGALTELEFEVVKTHTYKTRDILQQIHFDGIYRHVPVVAGAHHEKVDGSGYPQGLKGKEIPLGAKIIAVADFFEAITSKRHYRDPMPPKEAFRLLEKEKGHHFDVKVVDAFIAYCCKNGKATTDMVSCRERQSEAYK